ncbi:hypothetical protein CHARACLAT_033344 [Characodon lateralis]|uniref:Uncharacterized protein n=1 Tax=Characodon lateralis TaxID=208331 RepID=A0ABU7EPK0_9TELE|nr:hypothetical protein [Characodon lateralis]
MTSLDFLELLVVLLFSSMSCLSTLRHHSPSGEAGSHSTTTCQPQSPWLAHLPELSSPPPILPGETPAGS